MTTMELHSVTYLAPDPEPIRGTLLDAAMSSPDWPRTPDVTGLFESFNCIPTGLAGVFPCPQTFLTPPVQSASSTATTGGTLAAGTYRAKITALNSRGETLASNEISQVTTGATSTVTWNWAAVTGATGYKVYVTNAGVNTETFLVTVGAVTTYVWTGTPAYSAGNAPPPTVSSAVVNVPKTFGGSTWQDGIRFLVYTGVKCKLVGFDQPHGQAELERVFNNKESVAVARALMANRFIAQGSWTAAPDVHAAGSVDPVVGLALLEGDAASKYAGAPTIHMGRTIASILFNKYAALEWRGNTLYTPLGSKVAADGGYESPNNSPTGTAPAADEQWIYASGEVTVAAGDSTEQSQTAVNEAADSNIQYMLRERPYVASVDCYTAAVRVKVQ